MSLFEPLLDCNWAFGFWLPRSKGMEARWNHDATVDKKWKSHPIREAHSILLTDPDISNAC